MILFTEVDTPGECVSGIFTRSYLKYSYWDKILEEVGFNLVKNKAEGILSSFYQRNDIVKSFARGKKTSTCSYCKTFTVIYAREVPEKRPGCGDGHISVCYIFRGLSNIPNQSYKTQLPIWIGEKSKFSDVKHLLFITNRCGFAKISDKSLSILMGIYCEDNTVASWKHFQQTGCYWGTCSWGMTRFPDSVLASFYTQAGLWLPPHCAASWLGTRAQSNVSSFHLSHLQRTVCSSG